MGDEFLQNMKQSFSLSDIELMDHHFHFPYLQSPIDFAFPDNHFPGGQLTPAAPTPLTSPATSNGTDRKRKAIPPPEISPANSSAFSSLGHNNNNRIQKTKKRLGKGKKVKTDEDEDEKQSEVVHVRARRGQATDRHSLAERVRRKKINERIRCLQDIVPGCYKTMGMAMMLDEIINYVQSLQTQVEFLSTRLTTATSFHDFNPHPNVFGTTQRANTGFEALDSENIAAGGVSSSPLGLNFGYCPQLPHKT